MGSSSLAVFLLLLHAAKVGGDWELELVVKLLVGPEGVEGRVGGVEGVGVVDGGVRLDVDLVGGG